MAIILNVLPLTPPRVAIILNVSTFNSTSCGYTFIQAKSSSLYPPAGSKVISLEDLEREIISSPSSSSTPDSSTTSPHPRPYPPSSSPSHMTSPPTHMVPPPIGMGQHPPPGLPHPLPPRGVPMMPWLHQRPPLRGFPFLPPPNVPILRPGGPGGQGKEHMII